MSTPKFNIKGLGDGALVQLLRGGKVSDRFRIGPNEVHAAILHGPGRGREGELEDLGVSHNVMTTANNGGRDQVAAMLGGKQGFGDGTAIATGSSATSLTDRHAVRGVGLHRPGRHRRAEHQRPGLGHHHQQHDLGADDRRLV